LIGVEVHRKGTRESEKRHEIVPLRADEKGRGVGDSFGGKISENRGE